MSATVIIGDIHLGKGTSLGRPGVGSALNSRLVDQLTILDWCMDRAVEENASDVILTGDIFEDAKPHPMVISMFVAWLRRCTDVGLRVHVCIGNHERIRNGQHNMSALDIVIAADMENVHTYYDTSTFHTPGASFTMMPFRDRRSFDTDVNGDATLLLTSRIPYELSEIDRNSAKVVVGHLAIEGSLPVGDEILDLHNELFVSPAHFRGYDYVWMGHIHKPQTMPHGGHVTHIAHIGSMDLSDFGEADHQKIIVVFDPDATQPYRTIDIPSRALNRISVSVPRGTVDTTAFILRAIADQPRMDRSIVRLDIQLEDQSAPKIDRTAIERQLTASGAFHINRINEERKVETLKRSTEEKLDSTVNESTAIRTYAEVNVSETTRNDFIALASQIIVEHAEKAH